MSDEEFVKAKVSRSRVTAIPKKGKICSDTSHFEILVGLSAYPKSIGIGLTRELAWADARRRLEEK
jgi:hypothetical protein